MSNIKLDEILNFMSKQENVSKMIEELKDNEDTLDLVRNTLHELNEKEGIKNTLE